MEHTIAFVSAHPDDETFLGSCAILEAGRRGIRTVLLVATAGEASKSVKLLGVTPTHMAAMRKQEMHDCAQLLGIDTVKFLDYPDGKLNQLNGGELAEAVARFLREQRATIAVTFGADGMNGHPDHVAIHQAVESAVSGGLCPGVNKLYYYSKPRMEGARIKPAVTLSAVQDWPVKVEALLAHRSQMPSIEAVFGDIRKRREVPSPGFETETFVLGWMLGERYPDKEEPFFTDSLA